MAKGKTKEPEKGRAFISISVPLSIRERLEKLSQSPVGQLPLAQLVRTAIEEFLEKHEGKK